MPFSMRSRCEFRFAPVALALVVLALSSAPSAADEGVGGDDITLPPTDVPRTTPDTEPAADSALSRPPSDASADDLWSFKLGVYLWLPNLKGTAVIEDFPVHYDLSHGDVADLVFHNLKGYFGFYGEARRDRVSARLDVFYVEFSNVSMNDLNKEPPDLPPGWDSPLALNQHYAIGLFTPSVSFTAFETDLDLGPFDHLRIDPMVGFRYMYFEGDARVVDSLIPEAIGRKVLRAREHWWEPLPLGVEVELGFFEKWSLLASVMLGGWGLADSKGTTDGVGDLLLKYRISGHFTAEAGIRWLDMYVKGDDIDYFQMHNIWGPLVRVAWNF